MNHPLDELLQAIELPFGEAPLCLAIGLPAPALLSLPGFPQAASPKSGRIASGRGLTRELCRASALGEAAELVSCCSWGTEPLVRAREDELGAAALSPEALNGFSQAQIRERVRNAWNARYAEFDWRPPERDRRRSLDWLEVEDAFGGPNAFVPADFAFIGRKQAGDVEAVAIGNSNGCACGQDPDSAKIAAVLELIERDAAARWWYGRRSRPFLDPSTLPNDELATWLSRRERHVRLFDLTTDLAVPAVAAVSADADGACVAIGFSAHFDLRKAALAAATEMLQMEFSHGAARALRGAAGRWSEWEARVTTATPPLDGALVSDRPAGDHRGPASLAALIEICARHRIGLWFANMTRKVLDVPAFRAISPDLCPLMPRFGKQRLLAPDPHDGGRVASDPEFQVPLLV